MKNISILIVIIPLIISCGSPANSIRQENCDCSSELADSTFKIIMQKLKSGIDTAYFTKQAREEYVSESKKITDNLIDVTDSFSIVKMTKPIPDSGFVIVRIMYADSYMHDVELQKINYCFKIIHFSKPVYDPIPITPMPIINADSIKLENIVTFGKFRYSENEKYFDVANLIFKVTNKGHIGIPNLGVFNRCEYLKGYINDTSTFEMTLCNGIDAIDGDRTIHFDSTETFDYPWALTDQYHGKIFSIQWEYAGIKTKKIKVDLGHRTIKYYPE